MRDRFYLPMLGLAAVLAVALAAVWPQGLGDRSPGPFGREPEQRRPEVQAAMRRQHDSAQRRVNRAREAVHDLQLQALQPAR